MRGSLGDKQRLQHIIEAILSLEDYVKDADVNALTTNSMMWFACIKQIEIVGEASNNITQETKDKITDVDWKQIIRMRHILVHEYFDIDADVVWQVIKDELPKLKQSLEPFIASM